MLWKLRLRLIRVVLVSNRLCLVNFLSQHASIRLQTFYYERIAELWLEVAPRLKEWISNDINVAQLELEWIARGPVEEGTHREVQLALQITLLIVLFHLDGHPAEVEHRVLCRVRVVRAIQHHVQHQLFVLHRVLWELLRCHTTLECHYKKIREKDKHVSIGEWEGAWCKTLTDFLEMIANVSWEYRFDNDLAHVPVLSLT